MTAPSDTKTCDRCGGTFTRAKRRSRAAFATRRFCSFPCSIDGIDRPGRPRRDRCHAGLHDMDETNTRIDSRGRRSCKACAKARDAERPDRTGKKKRKSQQVVKRKPTPTPAPKLVPPPAPERPVWRPAGFAPQPNIRRAS